MHLWAHIKMRNLSRWFWPKIKRLETGLQLYLVYCTVTGSRVRDSPAPRPTPALPRLSSLVPSSLLLEEAAGT